jgi:cytochrome c oxidase subunit 1
METTAPVIEQHGHATAEHHEHAHPHPKLSWVERYLFSLDHKVIGIQFMFSSLFFLLVGGWLALMVRWQLGFPGEQVPWYLSLFGLLAVDTIAPGGVIAPNTYNALFTMHATFMVFFAIMPMMIGLFGNFLIPLQIGARDMAFPVLNMLSFWLSIPAGILMVASLFVDGGGAAAGWTSYAPLSDVADFTGVTTGQNLWAISLLVLGVSSIMGAINYITTVINMRAPGMTMFRMPLPVWSIFITAILLLLAIPVLSAAVGLLLMDRTLGTSFFLPAGLTVSGSPLAGHTGGGQPLLWQHLFWFFGHPEVYIMILPAMGITSEILSVFARKPIFGYRAMVFSICGIAFLGWIVWGHHMFQSGMNPVLGTTFMITTMVIAVPSAIKVFNWLGTLWGGQIQFTVPMLNALSFVSMFTIGGLSGIFMASTPVDAFIHDTYFIVAHIHYVLFGGSLFAGFAGISYWFPKMFGKMMNPTLGKIHFWLTFIAFNCTFFPMHLLGAGGHMRRVADPYVYEHLAHMQGMNQFITISAIVLGFSQLLFVLNIFVSLKWGKKAGNNPWHANTLEWTVPSPAGHGNFDVVPTVYHGPYEYSSPMSDEDYLPQSTPVDGERMKLAQMKH